MTKRSSQRHGPAAQSGCMWNVFSLFDFRQGRSTTKLLTDRKRESKQCNSHLSAQKIQSGWSEKSATAKVAESSAHAARQASSVKELVAAEMINEEGFIIPSNDFVINFEQPSSKSRKSIKNKQRKKNARSKSVDMDVPDLDGPGCSPENVDQVPKKKVLNNLDLETTMEELARISRRNTSGLSQDSTDGVPDVATVEKLVSVLKQVMEERERSGKQSNSGEEGIGLCSNEFRDALHMSSANKSLFLKLLRDQNSALVVHFQKLLDARIAEKQKSNAFHSLDLLEEKEVKGKPDESGGRNHWSLFRRSRSVQSPLECDKDYPSRIVVLKPGPVAMAASPIRSLSVRSQYPDDNKAAQGDINTPFFSFTNFKRKLRNAMGRERHPDLLSPKHQNGKSLPEENFGWSSPNRDHFYTERFAVLSSGLKPVGKSIDQSTGPGGNASQLSELRGSNIYIEAKKHLCDILKNVDENVLPKDGQFSKSLGRVLSFPNYIGSPGRGPRKYGDDIFITPQMRFSPLCIDKNNKHRNSQETPILRKQNSGNQSCSSCSTSSDKAEYSDMNTDTPLKDDINCSTEVCSFDKDTVLEIEEVSESRFREDDKIIDFSCESSSNSITTDPQERYSREADSEEKSSSEDLQYLPSLKSEFSGEVRISPPPMISPLRAPTDREAEDSYHATIKTGQPSPVSVLEPLFSDDDMSPAVQKETHPLHINFEEEPSPTKLGICTRISSEDEESAFEYLEAVLLGSGLDWDEFLMRWLSSYEILDASLFDEVELFSSRPHHNQRLLFDCANEALKDLTEAYFGCFSGISNNKQNIQPVPKGMDLIQEIWKQVDRRLVQHPKPDSLEQLVQMDMMGSRNWMKVLPEVEFTGFVLGDSIFDELVEDFILCFIDDMSKVEVPLPVPQS